MEIRLKGTYVQDINVEGKPAIQVNDSKSRLKAYYTTEDCIFFGEDKVNPGDTVEVRAEVDDACGKILIGRLKTIFKTNR